MKVYLDNCCFNRPYDDQSYLRIRLEAEAKLKIQEDIRNGTLELAWSYILDYENGRTRSENEENKYQNGKLMQLKTSTKMMTFSKLLECCWTKE